MATNVEAVITELNSVKNHFRANSNRIARNDLMALIAEVPVKTSNARLIVNEAVRKLYSGVIWEDDIRGYDFSQQLEIEIMRFKKAS